MTVNRETLVRVLGPAEPPPETMITVATTPDGDLYHVHYSIDRIEPVRE